MRIHNYLTLVCFCLVSMANLAAQTQFTGAVDNDWFKPGNWTNNLPAAGNDALVGGGATPVIGSPLTVNFTVTNFGTITVDAALSNGGTIANSGTFTVNPAGSLTNVAIFQNFGTTNVNGGNLVNQTGASISNGGSFTLQTILVNNGSVVNNGTFNASNATLNLQGNFDNNQTLSTKSMSIASGVTFTNNFGATLNISNTGTGLDIIGSMTNNGTVNLSGNAILPGTLANNVTFNVLAGATFTVFAPGQLNNGGTFSNAGSLTNGGTITNGNQFVNSGTANNNATFNNNNVLNNQAGGTFNNNAAASISLNFGTQIVNGGTFTNGGSIGGFGLIQNDNTFTNNGTITSNSGGQVDNNGANFTNNGLLSTSDVFRNDGSFFNQGAINVFAGSVLNNFGNFTNRSGATLNNLQEVRNKQPNGIFTNNGILNNVVRFFAEDDVINNAYFNSTGDVFIEPGGGKITNTELLYLNAGNLKNQGTLVNSNKIWVNDCSTVNNVAGATINNNGNLEVHGILFQRGTLAGNAVNLQGGYVHTAAGSAAPTVCQNGTFGADFNGDVKVYASQLISNANFDSCANIVYLANGVDRPVFHCSDIGNVLNVSVVVRTRLNDSLTCTALVTPVDELAPTFANCPKDQVIFTPNNTVPATWTAPTATDNCTTVTLSASHLPGASFPIGITGVSYLATDTYGNSDLCQFRLDVRKTAPGGNCTGDATPPAFVGCPGNISKTTNGNSAIAGWLPPSATDVCYPIVMTSSHAPGAAFGLGSTTVTYTAKDGNNNSGACTFTVTVTQNNPCAGDNVKPVIVACPRNIYLPTNPIINGAVAVWSQPGAFDFCGVTQFTGSHVSGSVFPTGSTTVTYTAQDAAGNSSACNFTVTVGADPCPGDVAAPLISGCPANINLTVPGFSATANWTAPTASDACAPVTVNATHVPGSTFFLGSTQVSYQFSDRKGNTSTCNFNVNVQNACDVDAAPPVISGCPSNVTVGTSGTSAPATWTPPTVADNCSMSYFAAAYLPGAVFPLGTTTVVYTAIDVEGNSSNCSFNVTIVNAPGCTSNAAPIDSTTNVNPASVTLSWVTAAGASAYDVYLGTTNPPATAVATDVAGTSTTVTNLLGGTTYFWYVVPKNSAGSATGCASTATLFITSSVACNVCTGNLLTNGCFENGLSGFVATGGATTTSPGRTGVLAGYLCNNGAKLEASLPGVVGGVYTFSGWATKPNNNTTGNFSIAFKNSAGTVLATATSTLNLNAWKQYTITATAPANTATVAVAITKTSNAGCITTDDWCLTVVMPCNNVTNAGTIAAAQTICPNADPAAFTSTAAASGGTGTLTYKWQKTTLDPATNPNSWTDIAGTNSATYDSPALSVSTWFRRGAVREFCTTYLFTAALKVTVGNLPPTAICQNLTRTQTSAGQTITITAAEINNGSTAGCGSITNMTVAPSSFNAPGTFTVTLTVTNTAGLTATCTATVTIVAPTNCTPVTFSKRVNASSDDAEQTVSSGSVDLTSSDLELGYDDVAQIVGMRFTGVTIPKNAIINSAYVEFEVDETTSGTTVVTFKGEDVDDAATFTTATNNLSNRVKTTANTSWTIPAWNTVNQKWQSPNLASIIQEIVDRGGWVSGNDIAILVDGTGERVAESYNGESAAAPLLVINYNPCVCSNVTNGGTIAKSCGNPGQLNFTNVTLPSGGTGNLEYLWISGTTDCDPDNMTPVSGGNASSLSVASPSVTTYYIRCSRRAGCTDWVGESNCITVQPYECQYDANKCYKLVNKYSGKILDIFGAEMTDNTKAIQWTEHGGDNQKFKFSYAGNGYWHVMARHSNKFLDTENAGSTADNAKVVQYTFDGSNSQQWLIEPVGGGYVKLTNKLSDKAMKIASASTADGIDVVQLAYSNSDLFKWQIVEVTCCDQDALLVVGNATLDAGDTWVKTRLETLGFTVTVKDDDVVVTGDATGKGVVVISSTVLSTTVNTKFTNVAVPVVTWESALLDDLKMTGPTDGVDNGGATANSLVINDATHPLAAGLSGTVQVYTVSGPMRWGWTTVAGAAKAAKIGAANQFGVFGFEKGVAMQETFTAPARRVGLFMDNGTPQTLTANGIKLFDAAINWASKCNGSNFAEEVVNDRSETPENEQPAPPVTVENRKAITVFPNPAYDRLYVNLSEFAGKETLVRLFNANGQMTKEWKIVASEEPAELPLDDERSGYHVLWALPEGERRATAVKIVIER